MDTGNVQCCNDLFFVFKNPGMTVWSTARRRTIGESVPEAQAMLQGEKRDVTSGARCVWRVRAGYGKDRAVDGGENGLSLFQIG